jgi:hypothetical protein
MSDKASKDSKVITLTKFAPDDYHLWAAQSEATFIVHKVWEIVIGTEQSPGPAIPDDGSSVADTDVNAAITSTMRKKIASWNERHALARQALLTCLNRSTLTRVVHLKSALEIWIALAKEYSHVSNIKRGEAQTAFYSLLKDPSTPMTDHIDRFVQLQQQVDYHRPPSLDPMSTLEINLAFLRSLGEDWRTFHQSISNEIRTMSGSNLYARVKVLSYKAPENARPIANANVSEHQDQQSHIYRNGNRAGNRGAFRGRFKGGQHGYQSGNRGGFVEGSLAVMADSATLVNVASVTAMAAMMIPVITAKILTIMQAINSREFMGIRGCYWSIACRSVG